MTPDDPRDPPPPPPADGARGDLDDLVSALLDGVLRGDAADAARRRPDVAARLAGMAAARDALRDLPPPPASAREAAIHAALGAYDAGGAAPDQGFEPGRASVDDLGARRAARSGHGPSHRGRRWIGAAAAAVVVAAVGVAVARSGDDDATTATSADSEVTSEADDAGGSLDSAAPAPQSAPEDDAAAASEPGVELGAFPSVDALLDAATATRRAQPAPSVGAGADSSSEALTDPLATLSDRCPAGVPAEIARAGAEAGLIGRGTVDGAPVDVWSAGTADDPHLVALDAACAVLSERPLG
jgi:hypothetical protein